MPKHAAANKPQKHQGNGHRSNGNGTARRKSFKMQDAAVKPGESCKLEIPVARLCTGSHLAMPVIVFHGLKPGPTLWLSAAVHGDEINGVEIIRQVLAKVDPHELSGTVLAVPVVNVFGFVFQSRYLPDRRDLNRSFPGTDRGSLASQLANLFMTEVVKRSEYGIDLHTGSLERANLPQIRANLDDAGTRRCAVAFGAPVMIHEEVRDGSLREAAADAEVDCLLYEAGEPLRFNADAIQMGVDGVLRVMVVLKMLDRPLAKQGKEPIEIRSTHWVRAEQNGLLRVNIALGDEVKKGQTLGAVSTVFGEEVSTVSAPKGGLVIGMANNPLVNQGDGIIHLAELPSK